MPKGEYLQYGGQAIIEGVMMRSPNYFAVACLAPNGEIVVKSEALAKTWIGRQKWLKLPFLRGSLAILDSMALGIRAMRFASNVQMAERYQKVDEQAEEGDKPKTMSTTIQGVAVGGAMFFGLAMGVALFQFLPNLIAESMRSFGLRNGTAINYVSEIVKIVIFLGYIGLIGLIGEVKRIFKFHGAEHKAINVLEAEQDLTIENCLAQTRLHPRCGTSFAIIVLIVGMLVMPLVPRYPITGVAGNPLQDVTVRVLVELMILPFIAGISYEALRFAGRHRNQAWVNIAFRPGLASQYLTTREPDLEHIEVAKASLEAVILAETTGELVDTVAELDLPVTSSLETTPAKS